MGLPQRPAQYNYVAVFFSVSGQAWPVTEILQRQSWVKIFLVTRFYMRPERLRLRSFSFLSIRVVIPSIGKSLNCLTNFFNPSRGRYPESVVWRPRSTKLVVRFFATSTNPQHMGQDKMDTSHFYSNSVQCLRSIDEQYNSDLTWSILLTIIQL